MRRVSLGWMLLYGATRVGVGIHDTFFNAVAGFYLAGFGLSNAAIGFLANERSLIGSVLQPVTGAWSDRLRTRWGRRRPLMIASAILGAPFVASLWWANPNWSATAQTIFLGVGVIFLVMMGISWVRSRNTPPEIDESADPAAQPTPDADAPDHFR